MIQIHQVISYLRTKFEGTGIRVDGAAELEAAKDDSRLMSDNGRIMPTLFVMLGSFTVTNTIDNELDQDYDERFVILACTDNKTDRTGNNAQQYVYRLRLQLLSALYNYSGFDINSSTVQYVQDNMAGMDRTIYWHKFEFRVKGKLGVFDGVQPDLSVFDVYVADWLSSEPTADNPLATDKLKPLYYIPS